MSEHDITKTQKYYSYIDVAQITGIELSKLKKWCSEYDNILHVKSEDLARKFSKTDIEHLLFIKELIDNYYFNEKQAFMYCKEKGFELSSAANKIIVLDKEDILKELVSAVVKQISDKIDNSNAQQQTQINDLCNYIENNSQDLKSDILNVNEGLCNTVTTEFKKSNSMVNNSIKTLNSTVYDMSNKVEFLSRKERRKHNSLPYKLFHGWKKKQ